MGIEYENLDGSFQLPKDHAERVGFFEGKRMPRKLKKKVKVYMGIHYNNATVAERLWYGMGRRCPDYRRFIIKKLCE